MNKCSACQSLERAVERARTQRNLEKERIMRILLDQHRTMHSQVSSETVVLWRDGTRWTTKQGAR